LWYARRGGAMQAKLYCPFPEGEVRVGDAPIFVDKTLSADLTENGWVSGLFTRNTYSWTLYGAFLQTSGMYACLLLL
jgi:hypothetical protein